MAAPTVANQDYFSPYSQDPENKAPVLAFRKIWDQANTYYFMYPTAGSWAANVLTLTSKNHGLTSADSVILESNVALYNIGAVAATVLTANTFTVPLVGDPGAFPDRNVRPIYGSASWSGVGGFTSTGPTGGTANGTINQMGASGLAIPETWTITSTNATNFTVVGSRSGAKAAATAGTFYDNGQISFLLTSGTVAFNTGAPTVFTIVVNNGASEWLRVSCKKYSRLVFLPKIIQAAAAGGAGTYKITAKTHPDAPFVDIQAAGATATIPTYAIPYNIVRLERVAGNDSDMGIAYAQS